MNNDLKSGAIRELNISQNKGGAEMNQSLKQTVSTEPKLKLIKPENHHRQSVWQWLLSLFERQDMTLESFNELEGVTIRGGQGMVPERRF